MDRQQLVILLLVLALFIGGVIAAFVLGQQRGPDGRVTLDTSKRFVAKPGTTRDNAIALTSSKRPSTESPGSVMAGSAAGDAPISVKSLSPDDPEQQVSPSAARARRALARPDTQAAIAELMVALAAAQTNDERTQYNTALGVLHARDPGSQSSSDAAFAAARQSAETATARLHVAQVEAEVRLRRADYAGARSLLEGALAGADVHTADGVRLAITLGRVHEESGDASAAEAVYRSAIEAALAQRESIDPATGDAVRVAALRLVQLYRSSGRDAEAETLTQRIRTRMAPPIPGTAE